MVWICLIPNAKLCPRSAHNRTWTLSIPFALLLLSPWWALSICLPKPWCFNPGGPASASKGDFLCSPNLLRRQCPCNSQIIRKVTTCVTFSSSTLSGSAKPLQIWKTNSLTDGPNKVYNMCSVGGSRVLGEKQKTGNSGAQSLLICSCFLLVGKSHKLVTFICLTGPDLLTLWMSNKKSGLFSPLIWHSTKMFIAVTRIAGSWYKIVAKIWLQDLE